jgi:hypothetical protein
VSSSSHRICIIFNKKKNKKIFFGIFSLVDLGEDNDRNLKMPSEIAAEKAAAGGTETVETAEKATVQMAEQAGERPLKVNKLIGKNGIRK